MTKQAVTRLAKLLGAIILDKNSTITTYQFKTERAMSEFRQKIPYLSLWTGTSATNTLNVPAINVYFNKLK